jgi:predicted NBD/HSP70 family sugar kinase
MALSKKASSDRYIGINSKVGRNINRAIVLNSIREKQPISRAKISRITKLNKSTVSSIVSNLISEDLVAEDVFRNQEVGRNPINLRVKSGSHLVGAIYFESAKTELALVDLDGTVVSKAEIKTDPTSPDQFARLCVRKLILLRKEFATQRFRGIGVTVAGIVDSVNSRVVYAPNLGWENIELGKIIREYVPDVEMISIENDANASALAELLLGKNGIRSTNLVFLSVGTGIGAGILVDNRILSGSSHAAGELGHVMVTEGGEMCSCGKRGCWEVYASDRATLRRYAEIRRLPKDQLSHLTISDVVELAKKGDAAATNALSTTARYIGWGIASIIRAFDPEVIVIGGLITNIWDMIYPHIMEAVIERDFSFNRRSTPILPTSLTESPPLLGAAALSIGKIFTDYGIAL